MNNSLKINNVVWLADQLHSSMRLVVVVSEIRESGDSNPDFVKLSKYFGWLSEGEVDFEDQIKTFFLGEEDATADFLNLLCGRLDSAEEEFTKIVKRLEPELELLHSQPIQIAGGRAGKSYSESVWWWVDDFLTSIQEESAKFAYEKGFSVESTDKFFLKKFVCGICESVLQDFPEFDGHFIAQAINQELAKIDRKRIVDEERRILAQLKGKQRALMEFILKNNGSATYAELFPKVWDSPVENDTIAANARRLSESLTKLGANMEVVSNDKILNLIRR